MTWKDDLRQSEEIGGIITIFVIAVILFIGFLIWTGRQGSTNHVTKHNQTHNMPMPFP